MRLENLSKKKENNNVLVIGNGYIGKYLSSHIQDKFDKVYIGARKYLDYHDYKKLWKFLLNNKIDIVINCSGFTGTPNVDEAELRKPECWNLNVAIPLQINTMCSRLGVKYVHISSGCIYDGVLKDYNEDDTPNFGLFNESSFYSKSKHAFELMSQELDNKIIRIRMPVCNDLTNPRNYLKKIMEYPNLINFTNSKTYIPELCGFVETLIESDVSWYGQDIYNVVNQDPLSTEQVISQLNLNNEGNWNKLDPNWVKLKDLDIIAPRSNCVLDNTKASKLFKFSSEFEVMNMVCNFNNGISAVMC